MKPAARYKARRHALQALYQILFTEQDSESVMTQHLDEINESKVDADYFRNLLLGVTAQIEKIDQLFEPFLDRAIKSLTPIELCVLRLATYELKANVEIPARVIINEALELNKQFGTQEGFKFVNAVLDKVARELRSAEFSK